MPQNSSEWAVGRYASTSASRTSMDINTRLHFIWKFFSNTKYSFLTRRYKRLWWYSCLTSLIFQLLLWTVINRYIFDPLKTKTYKLNFFLCDYFIHLFWHISRFLEDLNHFYVQKSPYLSLKNFCLQLFKKSMDFLVIEN